MKRICDVCYKEKDIELFYIGKRKKSIPDHCCLSCVKPFLLKMDWSKKGKVKIYKIG